MSDQTSTSSATPSFITHTGGCHCKGVRWEVDTPTADIIAWECNCSICAMKRNIHFVVPKSHFRLLGNSKENLTEYSFNTHVARHVFCKVCGVQSYYHPRSNPDGIAITIYCVDGFCGNTTGSTSCCSIKTMRIKQFDGQHWEEYIEKSGISSHSKAVKQTM